MASVPWEISLIEVKKYGPYFYTKSGLELYNLDILNINDWFIHPGTQDEAILDKVARILHEQQE